MISCVMCGRNSETKQGFHLKYNLDFCSNKCIANYVELLYNDFKKLSNNHERRIKKLEKEMKE